MHVRRRRQMQQPRQRSDERVERLQVAAEESADDLDVGIAIRRWNEHATAVDRDRHRQLCAGRFAAPIEVGVAAQPGALEMTCASPCGNMTMSPFAEMHRRPSGNTRPTTALHRGVILDHVLDAGHQQRGDLLRGRASAAQSPLPLTLKNTEPRSRTARRTSDSVSRLIGAAAMDSRSSRADNRSSRRIAEAKKRTIEQTPATPGQAPGRSSRKNVGTRSTPSRRLLPQPSALRSTPCTRSLT